MAANEADNAQRCTLTIRKFADLVDASSYSTDELGPLDLLDAETELSQAWDDFQILSTIEWAAVRTQMSRADELYLWYYALRMAEMAVRRSDENFIRFAMMALVVTDKYTDDRDFYTALALILDAAKRINANFQEIFSEAARFASSQRRDSIMSYLDKRGDETSMDHVLEGIGYSTSGSKETFRYFSTV